MNKRMNQTEASKHKYARQGLVSISALGDAANKNALVVDLSENKLTSINGLEAFEKLSEVNLSKNGISTVESLKNLKFLKIMDLSYNNLPSISGVFSDSKIETLNLSHNKLTVLEGLSNLKTLKSLDVSNNLISKINEHSIENDVS